MAWGIVAVGVLVLLEFLSWGVSLLHLVCQKEWQLEQLNQMSVVLHFVRRV